jgi:hypothetical protein
MFIKKRSQKKESVNNTIFNNKYNQEEGNKKSVPYVLK